MGLRIGEADQQIPLAAGRRDRVGDDARDVERRGALTRKAKLQRVPHLDAVARRNRVRHEHGATGPHYREGARPISGGEDQRPGPLEDGGLDARHRRLTLAAGDGFDCRELHYGAHRADAGGPLQRRAGSSVGDRHADAHAISPWQDRGDPALRGAAGALGDGSERHDRRQTDQQRPDRQPGPHAVSSEMGATQQPLGSEEPFERAPDDPADRIDRHRRDRRTPDQDGHRHEDRRQGRVPARQRVGDQSDRNQPNLQADDPAQAAHQGTARLA